ncbi:MAG: hypothetical protein BroJett011_40590 [Chloroflexota bacterium]|nr:MAG: hypothetical protein BroJett011_40590 [Chloroflexota bacterium]
MPTLKDWLVTDSDTPPPFSLDVEDVSVDRRQMRSLLSSQAAPESVQELTPLQIARAYERSGNKPSQIHRLIKSGVPLPRLATALGMNPETVRGIYQREEAQRLQRSGLSFAEIGQKLGVSEAEARMTFARGHVQRYGANPAVQYRQKAGRAFPAGVFEQPTYQSSTNRDSASLTGLLDKLRQQLGSQGFQVETTFEADPLGGRHVVRIKQNNEYIGQPFRLTATPSGVPLISKTGKSAGGYRLTYQGQGIPLGQRLGNAVLQMAANHQAQKSSRGASGDDALEYPQGYDYAPPIWDEPPPSYDDAPSMDMFGDDEGYVPELPAWMKDEPGQIPTGPPPFGESRPNGSSQGSPGNARGKLNVLDLLEMDSRENKNKWRQINAGDYLRLSRAGQFREDYAEGIARDEFGQWAYPPELSEGSYPHTPVVSKGTVYPLEARNSIAGNIELENGRQWGSQKGLGKQMKRDELSLTRKYWQAGPALGVAYSETPQHILGQRATEPETAHIAKAFILDKGGIIPEGQMWKDTSYAPWVFGSFEQNPEKFELRFDPNYSEEEVLKAAGLLGPDGKFRPRMLKQGQSKIAAPNGFRKELLGNNEAGVINGYEIVDTLNERGDAIKALRLKGYFGNRPNVVSAMKLEGWKNLAQDKNIRRDMGLDYDLIMNKPSDTVVANISMLNALPREEFEGLWREVHGETPAPGRTGSLESVEALAKVWQLYQERNRRTEIIPGRVFDKDTLDNYLKAGIIKDGKYEEVAPLFEGAETMYKADLVASGYMAPVRARFITDVTKLGRGNLSNEILRSVEQNFGGLGEHLRDLGYEGRDIYNTLFEMHRLNTKPGFSEHGSPVVDLIGDLTGNKDVIAATQVLYQQKLAEILPASMQGMAETDYSEEQLKAFKKLQSEAGAQAIRSYYNDALGADSYIFKMGLNNKEAAYMANPDLVERFGYIDEETNEKLSQLKSQADYQLKRVWEAVQSGDPGRLKGTLNWILKKQMPGVIQSQAELLRSAGARKRWFGTSDSSIRTHVHASDYALPRNAMAMNWEDIFQITGLKRTRANRAYLNRLSRAGQLPFSGLRNPASDPIAQTGTILNMVTPDLLKMAGLDIPTTGHPVLFHPHHVQGQGGDNDSDQSQVYMVMKKMAGELVNAFGLKPSNPDEITGRARSHAAGEYGDAVEKLNVTPEKARRNLLGFDPNQGDLVLDGTPRSRKEWNEDTLTDYQLNARQIGQAYNVPIRVGVNLTGNPEAQKRVSQYGGWLYQNPLDKKNYQPHSPEEDLFSFFTSFNAFTGSFAASRAKDEKHGTYYSWRKKSGFETYGQFGAAGLLSILKRLTQERQGTQAQMTPEQMAAMMSGTTGDMDKALDFIANWKLPVWEQLDSKAVKNLTLSETQQDALARFAGGDSPMAQMMRGYAVRNAIKASGRIQKKLQSDMLDPEKRAVAETGKFKADLREYVNVLQNQMYNRGKGVGSDEFKQDYETFLAKLDLDPASTNFFTLLEPGSQNNDPGEFYRWSEEKQRLFYKMAGKLFQKHVTGYGFDAKGNWRNLDPSVPRANTMFSGWFKDYDRIRDVMAINAREREEDEPESYVPSLDELAESEVTGRLVREKHTRKKKALGGLSRLFEQYQQDSGLNGSSQVNKDFEAYVAGRRPWTKEEQEMLRQAELGHEEARRLRRQRLTKGYEEPMYFAEGGVLDRATRIGQTQFGRPIVAGEAGREYVVPENKTQDLGGGVKVFDTDSLGKGAPDLKGPGGSGSKPAMLAKGGIIDYQAYANAPTSDFKTALLQIAQELTNGAFTGSLDDAKAIVGKAIEADIQKMMANPPQNGGKGLYATDITGRATDRMSQALGPNPAPADQAAWNAYLGDYGLSADFQPLTVSSGGVDAATRQQLAASGTSMADFLKGISAQVQGKAFSHANYGHVYDAIPGWSSHWNGPSTGSGHGNRPGATIPTSPLSATGAATLARLSGADVTPPPGPPFGDFPGSPVGPPTPVDPNNPQEAAPPGQLNEIVTVPKLTPQLMGEYRQVFDQLGQLRGVNPWDTNKEQLAQLKLAGQRGTDVFRIAQRSKSLLYQQQLVELSQRGLSSAQQSEYTRLINTYGNGDPDLLNNERGLTDQERTDLTRSIYQQNAGNDTAINAERYLFGRMEELHRNVRERGLSLTDTQVKQYDRLGLAYKPIDPEQLRLAGEFNDWFSGQFASLQESIPLHNQKGEPTYLGGAHPNFDPAYISQVLPQAHAARLKYESSEMFKSLTPDKVARIKPSLAEVLEKAEQVPFAGEQLKQRTQAEKAAARLGQVDQRLGDIRAWYNAGNAGRSDAFSRDMQPFDDAAEISFLSSQRQQAYEAAVPLKQRYDEAMKRGDLGTAQRLFDQIEPINTRIGELKDQIGALTPYVKEHVETLSQQTSVIREDLKERKQTYSALAAKEKELESETIDLSGAARQAKEADLKAVRSERATIHNEIKDQAKELGRLSFEKQTLTDLIHEPQGRSITGLGSRPQTYGQQAWNELKQGYSPQRLFWEFQNMQQMQYMAFMPMLQMRSQYLGEQAALGQANYALGAGTMPQSVLSAMASQANVSRASSAFGQGVDNSIAMTAWKGLTNYLGRNEGAGALLGSVGFDLTSGLTAAMGLKMVGGPAISALGKLAGGLGTTGAAPLSLGTMSAAALGGGGLIAGGLGLGLGAGIYQAIRPEGSASLQEFATVGAYGIGGADIRAEDAATSGLSYLGRRAGEWWNTGQANWWNQEKAVAAGTAVGKYTGAVTEPIPVWVTKMESAVAEQLGVGTDKLPFDRAELAQMVQMAAEDQGITKAQIEGGSGIAAQLAKEIAESYTSGVSLSQSSGLRQRAIDVSGYAPGTEGAKMMSAWVQQGSLFERQQRLQAASMVQNLADEMDFTPQQRRDMSEKVYDLLSGGVSQAQVARSMQQRSMSNQFTWSAAAYASGNGHLALMDQDQPWLPKNLTAQWAVEDRRRAEDNARELGAMTMGANGFESPQGGYGSLWQGGRQEIELGWQRQKLDLEEEFWTFRRKSQLDDFAMQQKLFDFNIRQQRQAMEFEERQSRVQSDYYEKQYALNKKIFDLQTLWQRHDFDKQEARLEVRRDWQLEDSAWNRESFQLQAGWQMEDMQRALRYASSGRERMDIRRQMERQSILNDRKQTEFDREDVRNSTQYSWAKEDAQDNRQRFEEMNELQRQQMELGREYWQQQQSMSEEYRAARRAALEEQIALQQEQNALNTQQFLDGMALTDKQHALDTQIAETKQQWALDDLALARERAAEDEKMLGLQREMMSASYFYSFYQAMGYDAAKKAKPEIEGMATAAGTLADYMERAAKAATDMAGIPLNAPNSSEAMFPGGSAPNTSGSSSSIYGPQMSGGGQSLAPGGYMNGPMSPAPPSGFARGGYTGDGDSSEVAGIVHRGEYVVPSGGALVVRGQEGNAEMVNLLSEMVAFQAAILSQLQEGGGTILIDAERLKKAGFLHSSNFSQVYR